MTNESKPIRSEVSELVRREVIDRGFGRVAVLGYPDDMCDPWLRRPLAASGVLVMVPGVSDRAWIGEALDELGGARELSAARRHQLSTLLSHAMEHGVQAVIVSHEALAAVLDDLRVGVPIIDVWQLVQ